MNLNNISLESYACAIVAMEVQADLMGSETKARLHAAVAEFKAAEAAWTHATFRVNADLNRAAVGS